MTGWRRPRRASLRTLFIVLGVYVVVMVAITLGWAYRDVIGGWW